MINTRTSVFITISYPIHASYALPRAAARRQPERADPPTVPPRPSRPPRHPDLFFRTPIHSHGSIFSSRNILSRPASLPAPIPAPLRARPLPRPRATSGDGGNNNNGNGGNGGNGGSGGGGGSGDDSNKDEGPISGWRARTRADPDFAFKVMVEQIIGVGAAVFGDMSSRPNFGLNELDFVFSTLIVGSLMNFALMYLLAPTVGINTAAMNPVMKFVTGETLRNLSAPTGHMFEPGVFTLAQRGTTVAYKAMQFGVIGFIAGLIGTAATNILISIRTATDPSFKAQNDLPEVWTRTGNPYAYILYV